MQKKESGYGKGEAGNFRRGIPHRIGNPQTAKVWMPQYVTAFGEIRTSNLSGLTLVSDGF
ncbi:hypothetical protein GA0115256_14733 [Streptomyces sp. DconLS]|nr:hypothetical protein GA0115258_10132 [Streptomyces sp. LamerLS-31b]SCG02945.1 hypothetical protein GA0115256_14733 [Streptomyces sp. DconLS]